MLVPLFVCLSTKGHHLTKKISPPLVVGQGEGEWTIPHLLSFAFAFAPLFDEVCFVDFVAASLFCPEAVLVLGVDVAEDPGSFLADEVFAFVGVEEVVLLAAGF